MKYVIEQAYLTPLNGCCSHNQRIITMPWEAMAQLIQAGDHDNTLSNKDLWSGI